MSNQHSFLYFPDYEMWARFSEEPCDCDSPCLDGAWFDGPDIPEAVCSQDLISARVRNHIPDYLKDQLAQSVALTHGDWASDQIRQHIEDAVDRLSRTPPVPWIQNNDWPVHHGDFCRYIGEWDQPRLSAESPDGDGKKYLMSIIEEPEGVGDPEALWESIGTEWTAVYVFECLECGKRIATEQSY